MTVFIASTSVGSDYHQREQNSSSKMRQGEYTTDLDDVTLLKHLVQNHSGFSDLKPEEYYDSAPRLCKLTFYSLTIQHLDKVWSSFLVLKICLSSNRLAV
ncbi:hypothetical protein HID58_042090 [Brassica napus]|uniref:BnaC01g41680D protein n=2 Tax=Brassica napus TaxID=3708 RepID=A0A078JD07_BRANA|nr:hypothetical protein HID58_042090 [Brassica napus]CAF2072654.1 unnamed protein product [Brassica napus]CDY64498.1 BnaC01g41680D [Brassica napus]